MAEDASLDEFLGGGDDESAEPAEEGSADEEPVETESTDEDATESERAGGVEPATTTYAWSGDGVACSACGETVERRWQQDGALVCSACKEW